MSERGFFPHPAKGSQVDQTAYSGTGLARSPRRAGLRGFAKFTSWL